jgi:hypothetical protein
MVITCPNFANVSTPPFPDRYASFAHAQTGAAATEGKTMVLRKMSTVFGVIAAGAIAGMIGQSLVANAGAPTLTQKTIYDKTNISFGSSDTANTTDAKTVLRITVHAPAAGQVDVVVNASMWTNFGPGGANTLFATQTFGRCGAPDTLTACAGSTTYYFQKPAGTTSSSDITLPYAFQAQLDFGASGNRTFYLNNESAGSVGGLYDSAHIQVAFTPKNPISNTAVVSVIATT